MQRTLFVISLLMSFALTLQSQQTVGLFQNDSAAFNGYTLFTPQGYPDTYLIDNCGNLVNTWSSAYNPGLAVYLLESGELLRTAMIPGTGTFSGGGVGGRIERYDWDGSLNWSYEFANTMLHQHHDVEPLPNGNFLMIAWEYITESQAINQGRDPSTVSNSLWPDQILEIEPVGSNQANIVWEWHSWNHLIQEFDSTKPNYGVVSEHPELIDLNHTFGGGPAGAGADWHHANGLDYNSDLDQIVISSRNFSEIWVIDHSTTTAEAANHVGGTYGKGGDLLYRYGNPLAYDRGTGGDQIFDGQHNPTWIPAGHPHEGKIMVFNNQGPGGNSSAVDIVDPPIDSAGFYSDPGNQIYGPVSYDWRYTAAGFYSQNISGATSQPNGNILICEGNSGTVFEVNDAGATVWEYVSPVSFSGPIAQGNSANQNGLFRAERYAPDFAGFNGKDLTPGDPIELNPIPSNCIVWNDSTTADSSTGISAPATQPITFSNLISDELILNISSSNIDKLSVFNMLGQEIISFTTIGELININTSDWTNGYYLLLLYSDHSQNISSYKFLKQ